MGVMAKSHVAHYATLQQETRQSNYRWIRKDTLPLLHSLLPVRKKNLKP